MANGSIESRKEGFCFLISYSEAKANFGMVIGFSNSLAW